VVEGKGKQQGGQRLSLTTAVAEIYCLPLCTGKEEVTTAAGHHGRKVLEVTGCRITPEDRVIAHDCCTKTIQVSLQELGHVKGFSIGSISSWEGTIDSELDGETPPLQVWEPIHPRYLCHPLD
jgi:hypothetical protein